VCIYIGATSFMHVDDRYSYIAFGFWCTIVYPIAFDFV
jgi:hypothetical protein